MNSVASQKDSAPNDEELNTYACLFY